MGINWADVSEAIKVNFKKRKLYFNGYSYSSNPDFLYGVVPVEKKSFKPKVLNILIIGTNYGNTIDGFDFSPILAAIADSKAKLDKNEFVAYETWIYIDMYSAIIDPDPDYAASLEDTSLALQTFCSANPDLRIVFKREITTEDNVEEITAEINEWYHNIVSR